MDLNSSVGLEIVKVTCNTDLSFLLDSDNELTWVLTLAIAVLTPSFMTNDKLCHFPVFIAESQCGLPSCSPPLIA